MMKFSISRKFFFTVFLVNIILMAVMSSLVVVFTKNLERDFLQQDYIEEREFILGENIQRDAIRHRTNSIIIEYIPNNVSHAGPYFTVFNGLNAVEQLMLELDDHIYVINISQLDDGMFFHARDITHVLARERRFLQTMAIVCLLVITISLALAYTSSQRVVMPLKRLSKHIKETEAGKEMQPIDIAFDDVELHEISMVFNQFLSELGKYVDRERSLVGMASHELKTPISVILGAIEVIKSRHSLSAGECQLLDRIENAADEMNANISVLLKLSRSSNEMRTDHEINMEAMIDDVLEDLSGVFPVSERIVLESTFDGLVRADSVLVKMLVRNLIQNGLQHTKRNILISLSSGSFSVLDHGTGMSGHSGIPQFNTPNFERSSGGGLGLYIVTLICERLNWRLSVVENHLMGSTVTVRFTGG